MNAYKTFFSVIILSILFASPQAWAQQGGPPDVLTLKQSLDLRDGPGSYYDLVVKLYPGVQVYRLDTSNGWHNVRIDEHMGWIPDQPSYYKDSAGGNTTEEDTLGIPDSSMDQFYRQLAGDTSGQSDSSPYASPAEVAAAVKGFSRKYKTRRNADTRVDFSPSFRNRINAREYRRFRRSRIDNYDWNRAKNRFPLRDTMPEITPEIETMGWAIAGVIAQQGFHNDTELQKYLNYVALLVTESSHRYDIPVQVHILDTDDVVGYSTPNGIIFVSRGALKFFQSEAEFAFFVGHELAHIVIQHGIRETENRKVRIKSDKAFAELEKEMDYAGRSGDKYVEISNRLSDWTDQVYDYIVKDKLEAYEHEADHWGMVYAFRAGYNPSAALHLLKRFREDVDDFNTQIGDLEWQGASLGKRLNKCRETRAQLRTDSDIHMDYKKVYQDNTVGLF